MEVLNTFPTELFVFKNTSIDNIALSDKLEKLDNIEIKKTTTLSMLVDLRHNEDFKELFSWFDECLEEIRIKMTYDCEKFTITNSWFNRALGGYNMFQNYHRHSMSFFSGIYYVTEGSSTLFEDPVIHRTQAEIEVLRKDYNPFIRINPEPGKLVIFPSWMFHSSDVHLGKEDRIIISFNVLPAGKINHVMATDSRAEIKVL